MSPPSVSCNMFLFVFPHLVWAQSQIHFPCGIPLLPQAYTLPHSKLSDNGALLLLLIVCYLVFLCRSFRTCSGQAFMTSPFSLRCLSPADTSLKALFFPPNLLSAEVKEFVPHFTHLRISLLEGMRYKTCNNPNNLNLNLTHKLRRFGWKPCLPCITCIFTICRDYKFWKTL